MFLFAMIIGKHWNYILKQGKLSNDGRKWLNGNEANMKGGMITETSPQFDEIAQPFRNICMCLCACVCVFLRLYILCTTKK